MKEKCKNCDCKHTGKHSEVGSCMCGCDIYEKCDCKEAKMVYLHLNRCNAFKMEEIGVICLKCNKVWSLKEAIK